MTKDTDKVIKTIKEYSKRIGKPLKLTEQEFNILSSMILSGFTVEDYLYAKGKCLSEGWIGIK